ncbi:MAG: hypothetical protein KA313_11265 [Pseudarcicella sp.]|nr:hypothetical protein [Pseudarcicella sp.]MBP6411671.1 hypothetical protein [Pseudarcicella sp.]
MKSTLVFILVIFFHIGHSQTDTTKNTLKRLEYKIEYPKNWKIDTSKFIGTDFYIFSTLENKDDKFRENINEITQNLKGKDIDLEKFKQISDNQVLKLTNNSEVIESVIIKEKNKEYFKLKYIMTQGVFRLIITSICYIKDEKAYLLTFTCESEKYDQYEKVANEMLNSFCLIE